MGIIKAAVCHRFGAPLSIENVHLRAPEAGEIEVALDAVAICHSDITYAAGSLRPRGGGPGARHGRGRHRHRAGRSGGGHAHSRLWAMLFLRRGPPHRMRDPL